MNNSNSTPQDVKKQAPQDETDGYDNPRTLARTATPFGGVIRRVFYIECGRCAKSTRSYAKTKKAVEEDLRLGGWRITVQGWTCPDCLNMKHGGGAK